MILNLTGFNTSSVQTMERMFFYCFGLVIIDQHFTSKSLDIAYAMFANLER